MKTLKNGFSNVRTSIHTFVILIITLIFSLNVPAQQQLKNLPIPEVKQLSGVPILDTRPFTLPGTDHVVEEYIVKGKATSYKAVGELPSDGFWNVEEADTASYTTRYVVIRPVTADKFNGSVIVEWINVTGGFDFSPSRIMMWRELARNGSVWIGVSAQKVGVEGGLTLSGMSTPLKKMNPERYAQLHHPGDAFSYDIYTQAGRFLKGPNGSKVLGGLSPKHVIAMGQSQSAFYMTTYINAVHPIVQVYDGFLNYSRFAFAAPLSGADITSRWVFTKDKVKMRTDLKVPMLIFETETDIVGSSGMMAFLGYSAARQPDTDMIRVWEVPGTAHSDTYLYGGSRVDTGTASYETLATAWAPSTNQPGMQLKSPINNAPQHHYVVQAAISALEKWVAKGNPPAHATPIEVTGAGTPNDPIRVVLDKNGNAKGGIRTPWLDVPTSKLSGSSTQQAAILSGSVEPFDTQKLDSLYPGGKVDYLKKFEKALDKQIKAGFILKEDKKEIIEVAKLSYKGSH